MGDVVASGGYYMAAAADALFAEVGTITGSIGVVGGKVDLEGFYRRVGLAKEGVERGARAGLLSEARGFTREERAAVRARLRALRDRYAVRIAGRVGADGAARGSGGGRVW